MGGRFRRLALALLRRVALAAALSGVLAGSALLTMWLALSMHEVEVPSVVGKGPDEASVALAGKGLTLRVVGRRYDVLVSAGRIAAQEPLAHSKLKANRTVRAWMSLGPRRTEVPNVVGSSLRSARLALNLAGIPLARVVEVPFRIPSGDVILQRPEAGATGFADPGVSLLVSRGPSLSDFVMPDLIGRPVDDVLDSLRLAGLKVADIRYRPYPGRAPGTVIGQSPRPGYRVGPVSSITLDIIRGEE
jgi:beta-lactam-binding protein with PASTA domain